MINEPRLHLTRNTELIFNTLGNVFAITKTMQTIKHILLILSLPTILSSYAQGKHCSTRVNSPIPLFTLTMNRVQSGKCLEFSTQKFYDYIHNEIQVSREHQINSLSGNRTEHIKICRDSKLPNLSRDLISELYQAGLSTKPRGGFVEFGLQIKTALKRMGTELTQPIFYMNTTYNSCTNKYRSIDQEQSKEILDKYNRLIEILRKYEDLSHPDQDIETDDEPQTSAD